MSSAMYLFHLQWPYIIIKRVLHVYTEYIQFYFHHCISNFWLLPHASIVKEYTFGFIGYPTIKQCMFIAVRQIQLLISAPARSRHYVYHAILAVYYLLYTLRYDEQQCLSRRRYTRPPHPPQRWKSSVIARQQQQQQRSTQWQHERFSLSLLHPFSFIHDLPHPRRTASNITIVQALVVEP